MADHRVTDLSHGHLGKAIYDHENKCWNFSIDMQQGLQIRLIQGFKNCVTVAPVGEEKTGGNPVPSVLAQIQMRWLSRSHPEMLPAIAIVPNYLKIPTVETAHAVHEGCLLTVAHAKDVKRISGSHRPPILAFPSGESGHILHLIRLKPETRGWNSRKDCELKMLISDDTENGYWTGSGGAIRQIVSADDEERRMDSWLAVRQDSVITVFQPVYSKFPDATDSSTGKMAISCLSPLQPNPIASLTPDRTASTNHVDISFNPFYPRQFAIIDESGRWSIWNVENTWARGNAQVLVPGRTGDIFEDQAKDGDNLKGPTEMEHADGWHKVLWTCNVNTIVICSRRRVVVFDVASTPERLNTLDFLPVKGNDWIIDVVRSPTDLNYLFILTTSRIYWIKIIPAGDVDFSTKVLLSYRHFRDENDESMRLTTMNNGHVSVAINSAQSPLVNVYYFLTESSSELSCQSSLILQHPDASGKQASHFRALCFQPCTYEQGNPKYGSKGHIQHEENIAFYQAWGLTRSGVSTALCAVQRFELGGREIDVEAPDKKKTRTDRRRSHKTIEEDFIVSDLVTKSEDILIAKKNIGTSEVTVNNDRRFRVDWSAVFERAFGTYDAPSVSPDSAPNVPELLARVNETITQGLQEDLLPMDTCANIAELRKSSGELDEASSALDEFFRALKSDIQDPESTSTLVLSNLASCPGTKDLLGVSSTDVNLFSVHEQLVRYWITSLPLEVSYQSRLAKFRIIRQLGVELCLNSVGISLQNKASSAAANLPIAIAEEDDLLLEKENVATTRESSPGLYSSQPMSSLGQEIYSSLLTPSRTPSMYSHATSTASDLKEDPAISRLRQYAVSIRARPDPGKSALLSHWPSQPGVHPKTYSYEAMQKKAAAEDSGNESEHQNKKEEARRRKRTEKFLRQERERVRATRTRKGSMSQPMVARGLPSGSQPEAHDTGFSSQMVVDEIPMTQPVGGAHGSRFVGSNKKQKKQRKAGF